MTESQNAEPEQKLGVRCEWAVKKTASGIEIAGGSTTVMAKGTIIGSSLIQGPNGQPGVIIIIAGDDKSVHVLDSSMCRIL